MKKKDKAQDFHDDGHTVADMNVEGLPWYRKDKEKQNHKALTQLDVTKAERRAMIKAAYKAYLPMLLVLIGGMAAVYWLLYFLLRLAQ